MNVSNNKIILYIYYSLDFFKKIFIFIRESFPITLSVVKSFTVNFFEDSSKP